MIEVSVDTNKGPTLTAGTLPVVLPDSLRYSLAETTGGWAACTVVPVGQTPIVADVRIAIDGTSASFGADPAEPDDLRLHLAVQTRTTNLLESYVVLLSYEATVVVPISVR
jgi:hypothetical protein